MLAVRDATKAYWSSGCAVPALRGASIDVPAGLWTAVLGPSGSGKTTLLRVIAGFERLDRGTVKLGDRTLEGDGVHGPPQRRGIGMLFQDGALFPHLDVAANVAFGLGADYGRWSAAGRRRRARRVAELLELVGLGGYGRRRVHELSGGEQQRVALARALAPAPQVVLLDEPFSALDAALRASLREQVAELLRSLGVTVVLVTHDQEEALSLADQVAVMLEGRIVQAGRPADLYRAPGDARTASFLGDAVLLPGTLVGADATICSAVDCPLGRVPLGEQISQQAGTLCTLMLRPEQLVPDSAGIEAHVVSGTFYGHDALIRVRLGATGDGPEVMVRTLGEELPATGSTLRLRVEGPATIYPLSATAPWPGVPA